MSIGTIVSDASIHLKFWSKGGGGKQLGSVEEGFIARLKPGDGFLFAGRLLELVRVENMTAYVKRSTAKKAAVPRWNGGRMPLSNELAAAVVSRFTAAARGELVGPEMLALQPLLQTQARWSGLPTSDSLLAEVLKSREGWHLFLYPFAGRQVHLGLASLLAWRMSQRQPLTFSIAVNDYGLELLSATPVDWSGNSMQHCSAPAAAARRARQPECRGAGVAALSRNCANRRAGVRRLSRRTEKYPSGAGLQRIVLRSIQAIRRRQPAAGPGRGRSLAGRTGYPSSGTDIGANQPDETGHAPDQTAYTAGLSVAGGAHARKHELGKLADRIRRMVGDLEQSADKGQAS